MAIITRRYYCRCGGVGVERIDTYTQDSVGWYCPECGSED